MFRPLAYLLAVEDLPAAWLRVTYTAIVGAQSVDVEASFLHHQGDIGGILQDTHVVGWITLDRKEIGQFPWLDGGLRGIASCGANCLQRAHAMRDVELQLSRRGTHFRYIVDVRAHGDTHAALVHAAKCSETMRLDCSLCRNERWREPQLDILGNHIIGTVEQRRHDPDAGITHPGYRIVVAVDHVLDGIDAGVHAHSQPFGMKTVHRDRLAECMRFVDDRIELLLGHIAHVWASPERNPAGDGGLDSVSAAADEF